MDDRPGIAADKQRLRDSLLAARRGRDAAELERARHAVADIVTSAATAEHWTCVAAYEPMRTEPGSAELLSRLVALGVDVLVPITLPDHDLDWTRWSPRGIPTTVDVASTPNTVDAERVALGVDAIAWVDAVLVPALAVGHDGTRLGRGGGSYDRALGRCSPEARRIALIFDGETLDTVPVEPWDVPVDAAITPSGRVELDDAPPGNTAVTPED